MEQEPKTLQEAVIYFADPTNRRNYLVARRWPEGVTCPRCGSDKVVFLEKYNRWQCSAKHDARQFTAKTGTIMEDSPISLDKWLMAMWLIVNCKNGISSYEIHRAIGVTQKSAWFLDHRIRLALSNGTIDKMSGEIEADETFIGDKARNMHVAKRERRITGTGGKDKTAVMGILERGGKVRVKVVPNRKKKALQAEIRQHVEAGSALYTDALLSYNDLAGEFAHQVVDHAVQYVDGKVVSRIYSTDKDLYALSKKIDITCVRLWELPLPPPKQLELPSLSSTSVQAGEASNTIKEISPPKTEVKIDQILVQSPKPN